MALNIAEELGADSLASAAGLLGRPAEEFMNDNVIEELWAYKAFEHAEIYFNLISSVDPKVLRLTRIDDEIYKHFREAFPDLKVGAVTHDILKSDEAKEKWRNFCETYKDQVADYNYGTLIRLDSNSEYSEANSIVVPRVQFFAIELARNREGDNDNIRINFKPKKRNAPSK